MKAARSLGGHDGVIEARMEQQQPGADDLSIRVTEALLLLLLATAALG